MNRSDEHLKRIKAKLQQLLKQQALLLKENQLLKDELGNLKAENAAYGIQVEQLKQKSEIWKYSHGEMDEAEKKQMEKRINLYLKEIDRCITMLGQ